MSSIPKVQSTLKTLFPQSIFPSSKTRLDPAEVLCVGAANYGKSLIKHVSY